MPEKPRVERERRAKARGVPVAVKERDVTGARRMSTHAAKKSGGMVSRAGFDDRNVSIARSPGMGKRRRGVELPLPDAIGSSASRRKTLPSKAAAAYRKEGRRKATPASALPDVVTPSRKRARAVENLTIRRTLGGPKKHQRTLHKEARRRARGVRRTR
ncbi:MAG: hypothetical protein L0Y66_03140 [Myxococcaceae bacterium]|nr:hypothetical protein [Myxococcaceae bacterium]MCI0670417.1 hypothetical protein [Myxococcaceae bacterium]